MKIGIVTDSMSDLPSLIAEKHGIVLVPGIIHVDDQQYSAGVDITLEDISRIIREKRIRTSSPPPGEYYRVYERLYSEVDAIFSIHSPAKLSAIIKAAKLAAKRLDVPSRVTHFECGAASLGLGLTAVAAAIASRTAGDLEELKTEVTEYCQRAQLLGTIDSFEYVNRSGRLKLKIAAVLASTFKIKPVMAMQGADIYLLGKPRSREKAKELLVQALLDRIDQEIEPPILGIGQFGCLEEAEQLKNVISSELPGYEVILANADPMIASYTGPGLILLAYFGKTTGEEGEKISD